MLCVTLNMCNVNVFVCQEITFPNIPSADSFQELCDAMRGWTGQDRIAEDDGKLLGQAEGEGPFFFTLTLHEVDQCFGA